MLGGGGGGPNSVFDKADLWAASRRTMMPFIFDSEIVGQLLTTSRRRRATKPEQGMRRRTRQERTAGKEKEQNIAMVTRKKGWNIHWKKQNMKRKMHWQEQ